MEKIIIECECGSHLLQVVHDTEMACCQSFYLAMFYHGISGHRREWYYRIPIALKYLWTGKMFKDQLSLNQEEAKRLSTFINQQMSKKEMNDADSILPSATIKEKDELDSHEDFEGE